MPNRKITLKRNNSGTVEPLFPTTTSDQILTDDGLSSIFTNNKINYAYLPDGVKYGLKFEGTVALSGTVTEVQNISAFSSLTQDNLGKYVIVSAAGKLAGKSVANSMIGDVTYIVYGEESEYVTGSDANTEVINLEAGDWIIYTKVAGDGGDPENFTYSFSVLNNTHSEATAGSSAANSKPGIMSAAQVFKLSGIASSADNYGGFNVTDGTNSTTISSGDSVTFSASNGASVSNSNGTITISAPNAYSHPSHTARDIDTSGVDVLSTFDSDSSGHITGITTRTLPAATTSASGVMSDTDKTKLDATNVVQYGDAATSSATYGFIFFDED